MSSLPAAPGRIAFAPDFISGDLVHLGSARLLGSRCHNCGIVLFGRRHRCENCSSKRLETELLSDAGTIYTYTVQRYPPPPPFPASQPWIARPVAWVDLDARGPRILGPVDCSPEKARIDMRVAVRLRPAWEGAPGEEVIAFCFTPLSHYRADLA
jgi:uncharacterized OB-fold protein